MVTEKKYYELWKQYNALLQKEKSSNQKFEKVVIKLASELKRIRHDLEHVISKRPPEEKSSKQDFIFTQKLIAQLETVMLLAEKIAHGEITMESEYEERIRIRRNILFPSYYSTNYDSVFCW